MSCRERGSSDGESERYRDLIRKISEGGAAICGNRRGGVKHCGNAMFCGVVVGKTTFWTPLPPIKVGRSSGVGGRKHVMVLDREIYVNIMRYKIKCLVNFTTLDKITCAIKPKVFFLKYFHSNLFFLC
jgi:hypothetical protein